MGLLNGADALAYEVLGCGAMSCVGGVSIGLLLAWSSFPSSESLQSDFLSIFPHGLWGPGCFGAYAFIFLTVKGILSLIVGILSLAVSLLSDVVAVCKFNSLVNWLFASLANLGHLQGYLGLKLGSKSWSKMDS